MIDLTRLMFATLMAQDHAERVAVNVRAFEADARKELRQDQGVCKRCFYLVQRVCGQAFTSWECDGCGETAWHPNTCVPKLCRECSTKYRACRRCCADTELKDRRVLEPRR